MNDVLGRSITYLRLSVTELCDLRCQYCMAEEGVYKRGHEELCSFEELRDYAAAAAKLGVTKIRVTGGEPLVRRGIVELCAMLRAIPGVEELCLTSNGIRLPQLALPLRNAGVDRLNISVDSLRPERYHAITRVGELSEVWQGIEAAEEAGFRELKLNCVLLGGINDISITGQYRPVCANVVAICRQAELLSIPVILGVPLPIFPADMCPPEWDPEQDMARTAALGEQYAHWIRHYAADKPLPLADFRSPFLRPDGTVDRSLFQDGLHPTEEGHRRMADVLCRVLAERF